MTRQQIENKVKKGESLNGADLTGLDLSGARLQGADLEEVNLEAANLSGADLSGASLVNANLGRANLSGAILVSSIFEGSNLRNADLSGTDLTRSRFCEAYMGGASLVKATALETNFQGCYLGSADLTEAQLLGVNLESADLEKSDLRNSRLQGCRLDGANIEAAKMAGAILEGIIGDGIGSQAIDFSPQGDGSQIRTFSAEELEKIYSASPEAKTASDTPEPPAEAGKPPEADKVVSEFTPLKPSLEPPPRQASSETPPPRQQAPFERKFAGTHHTPEIKIFIGKVVTEEGMAGIALYLSKVKEIFGETNITLKNFSNKQGECLLTFTTDNNANLFVSVFLLLHFFKLSYEVELKELYNLLKETRCVEPEELEEMPVLDFWSLLPKFIKFPQAAFGFAEFKKEDLKFLEIILTTGQSINIIFQEGKLRIDYETLPYNIFFTVNIKDQLLRPIPHQKGEEISELLHNLLLAVGTDDLMKRYDKETACFAMSRFLHEITENTPSTIPCSPAVCHFWSIFWHQIRTSRSIAGAARSIIEYYPSLEILMT